MVRLPQPTSRTLVSSAAHFPALPEFLPQGTPGLWVSLILLLCRGSHWGSATFPILSTPNLGTSRWTELQVKAKTLQDASQPWALKGISRSLVFHSYNGKKNNNLFPEHILLSSTVVGLKLWVAQSSHSHGVGMKEAGRQRSMHMNHKHKPQPLRNARLSKLSGKGPSACTQAIRATHHSAACPLVLCFLGTL